MVTPELKPRSSKEAQTELKFISLSQTGRIRGPGLRDSRIIFCKSEFDFSRKSSDSSLISVVDIQWPLSSPMAAAVCLIFFVKTLAVVSQHHSLPIFRDLRFANRVHTTYHQFYKSGTHHIPSIFIEFALQVRSIPPIFMAFAFTLASKFFRKNLVKLPSSRKWHPSSSSNSGWWLQERVLTLGMCMLMVLRPIQAVSNC
ncbi:hypothetical protein L2E82_01990 [Cichorium intybus]|uniref:Uncharacterized protein n=1 Tax=Cichorium intybus TaxID=13427 RepID=A0ACB9H205_CICIN|nr:hypothetical protein L2E82_01990 [Cichorium intybus]